MTDNSKNEYNARQYTLMAEKLSAFEEGKLKFSNLIFDLKALSAVLDTEDGSWKQQFQNAWGTLEVASAVALDRNEAPNKIHVEDSLKTIKKLLQEKGI